MTERKIDFMKTDLFHIGKFVIHGYGLMIGIGFCVGTACWRAGLRKWE